MGENLPLFVPIEIRYLRDSDLPDPTTNLCNLLLINGCSGKIPLKPKDRIVNNTQTAYLIQTVWIPKFEDWSTKYTELSNEVCLTSFIGLFVIIKLMTTSQCKL